MTDGRAALVEQEKPHLIVPEIEAIATDMLVQIEAEGLAEVIPTARAAQLTMNREGIRRLAAEELGLPTSPYRFADSLAELQAAIDGSDGKPAIGYPCIVKPVMSSSGKGQSLLKAGRRAEGLGLRRRRRPRQSGPGDRRGLHRFRLRDHPAHRARLRRGHGADLSATHRPCRCRATTWNLAAPGDEPGGPGAAREIAGAVTGNLGGRGLFGVELFVKGDMVWFSEVSPRPHDTGLVTLCSQRFSEFELHARAILGLPVDEPAPNPVRRR
jgi:phosphoribosylglycinamide formyltransferase 2